MNLDRDYDDRADGYDCHGGHGGYDCDGEALKGSGWNDYYCYQSYFLNCAH